MHERYIPKFRHFNGVTRFVHRRDFHVLGRNIKRLLSRPNCYLDHPFVLLVSIAQRDRHFLSLQRLAGKFHDAIIRNLSRAKLNRAKQEYKPAEFKHSTSWLCLKGLVNDLELKTLLLAKWHDQDKRIEAYKVHQITDEAAHDLLVRSVDVGVCANSYIPGVLKHWREPEHSVFEPRNVWSLFNAFTATLKSGNLGELPKRTLALHGLLDVAVGLN